MASDVTQLVDKLKQGAVARCKERVLRAAKKTRHNDKKKTELTSHHGLTTHLKERRGL